MEPSEGCQEIEGLIRYFNLSDWWFSSFAEAERKYIVGRYPKCDDDSTEDIEVDDIADGDPTPADLPPNVDISSMGLATNSPLHDDQHTNYMEYALEPGQCLLTQGKILHTNETTTLFLSELADLFDKPSDIAFRHRILAKAENIAVSEGNAADLDLVYSQMVHMFYRDRNSDPRALSAAIEACEKHIGVAPRAAEAFKCECPEFDHLPAHVGFTQLAIIREKQGDYAEAIRLSKLAMDQGWDGDWERRIVRCEKKLAKRSGNHLDNSEGRH